NNTQSGNKLAGAGLEGCRAHLGRSSFEAPPAQEAGVAPQDDGAKLLRRATGALMKPSILENKDVWAGLFLIVVGVLAAFFAGTEFRLIEMLIFSVLLTALCAIVFVWALGLPYPLIAGF